MFQYTCVLNIPTYFVRMRLSLVFGLFIHSIMDNN